MSKNTYILFLLCWLSLPGHSQNHHYRQYTTDDGLPSNYVYGVIEDNDGYIWAYTENGLAKEFHKYLFYNLVVYLFPAPLHLFFIKNEKFFRLVQLNSNYWILGAFTD